MIKQPDIAKEIECKAFLAKEVTKFGNISADSLQKFTDAFEFIQYRKNHKIIKASEYSDYLYFLSNGLIVVYYHKSGNDIIDWFGEEGTFFGNLYDFIKKTRSRDVYETIEDVDLLRVKFTDLMKLFETSPEILITSIKILEQHYVRYIERVHNLKSLQAEEKYCLFLKHCSAFCNRIPLKYVANYLGITSETLSRIRARQDVKQC
ncbi:MAG: cAMP-binding protein [Bacteroidota bacterium]|nr:cAMP-binding protein [Bacteroidota bacterium]